MANRFELMIPTDEIICFYNRLWDNNSRERKTEIQLFQNDPDIIDVEDYLPKNIGTLMEKDRKIQCYKIKRQSGDFLREINSTYHTRLSVQKEEWNSSDWDLNKIDELCNEGYSGLEKFIAICKQKTGKNAYSFATKVFNFMCPDKFPILDSITVSLLNRYYSMIYNDSNRKRRWGNYGDYIDDYIGFLHYLEREGKITSDLNMNIKRFDIFLWTYGIVIGNYWEALGVIRYAGVEYKA